MKDETAVLRSTQGEAMSLLGVTACGKAVGLHFELAVEQRYRNATGSNLEVVYTFPLPISAVLLDLEVRLGGKTLKGVVVEKSTGEARYEEALDKGDTAILLEQAGDGLYTVNFGNLMAGEEATIAYRYAERLHFEHGSVRLTIPTVIAPRYGDPRAAGLAPHQVPTHDLALGYPFALTLELLGPVALGTLTSPSHGIAVSAIDGGTVVTLAGGARLDRDFVLVAGDLAGRSLAVVARDGDEYVAMASFCAEVPPHQAEAPLRLKLLLDCSGSMGGDSIAAAKRALHEILSRLQPQDHFSLSRFGSHVEHVTPEFGAAEAGAVRQAANALRRIDADLGGTEMEEALTAVFALGEDTSGADVLLITDGEVFGADALVARARSAQQRVFVVGIGAAPAEGVLRTLAGATGGACEFIAPNEGVQQAILRMFLRLRAPRIARAEVAWPVAPRWVTPLPTGLFGGETVHVYAGFAAPPQGTATLALLPAGAGQVLRDTVALPAAVLDEPSLPRMAAALRIESAGKDEALALALRHQLLTAQTNCVIVHERAEGEKATDLPQLQKVAQMHAAGWGGMGTVCSARLVSPPASMDFDMVAFDALEVSSAAPEFVAPMRRRESRARRVPQPPAMPSALDRAAVTDFLRRLEATYARGRAGTGLPNTIAGIVNLGGGDEIGIGLAALVLAGHDEAAIVRAFWEALHKSAVVLGVSRQLQRVLRHQFANATEHAELRRQVASWVGSAIAPVAP
jgi:Ca-activated chloride channel family protein